MTDSGVNTLEYSAGAVSKGFWFQEFKKYNTLLNEGLEDGEIKKMQEEENILLAPSADYGKKMINEVSKRTKALPTKISTMFIDLPVSDQKILNLLGIMMTDRLFFEYMYEVYREKIITGNLQFDNSDTRVFLKNKSEQSTKVANFTSQTKKRLAGAYGTYLKEANLIVEVEGSVEIRRPILDIDLENRMKDKDLAPYLRAFLGE
ncbi:MAG TPA: DUF1819 family protein [Tepidimicrobium sp.]|nr:DUF1819 family protein [Tepidimicrobium sp.]